MLRNDSKLPLMEHYSSAAFIAEINLNQAIKNNNYSATMCGKHTLTELLTTAAIDIDYLLSSCQQKKPPAIILTSIMGLQTLHVNLIIQALHASIGKRKSLLRECEIKCKSRLNDILLSSMPLAESHYDFLIKQLLSLFNSHTCKILMALTGDIIWDKHAWEYLKPQTKQFH